MTYSKITFMMFLLYSSTLSLPTLPIPEGSSGPPGGPEASTGGTSASTEEDTHNPVIWGPMNEEITLYWEETELLFLRACNVTDQHLLEHRLGMDGDTPTHDSVVDNSHSLSFSEAERNGGYVINFFSTSSPDGGNGMCEEIAVRVVNSPLVRYHRLTVWLILTGPNRQTIERGEFDISLPAERRPTTTTATTEATTTTTTTVQQQQTRELGVVSERGVGSTTTATSTAATSTAEVPAISPSTKLTTIVAGGVAGVIAVVVGVVLIAVIVARTKCRLAAMQKVADPTSATPSEMEMRES